MPLEPVTPQHGSPILEVHDLKKHFKVGHRFSRQGLRLVRAVDGVSLVVNKGETLGLVGESGCGKSTLARCLVRLHPISSGSLKFLGRDISYASERQLRPLRPRLQMVFQDPYTSLNPRRRVGDLIAEPLRVHTRLDARQLRMRVIELMELVGLNAEQLERFPHEFSGGQRQRIGIARALALSPDLVIADEPVSALDVSIQAQIINLLAELQERLSLTYVFIAHDLSVVRQVSSRTAVMYLGRIVEIGDTTRLYGAPAHPYTEALLSAVPVPHAASNGRAARIVLAGETPSPSDPPSGCHFHPRCRYADAKCGAISPPLLPQADGRLVACHYPLAARPDAALSTERT
jgi:peptide/nickel transport system ATP-binding protein